MITWIPWNPVSIKKEVPKVESVIVKKELEYSIHWRKVKTSPKKQVKKRNIKQYLFFPTHKKKCLRVTVTPDIIKVKVLIRGTSVKSNMLTSTGGQCKLISNIGDKKKWK